uniref:Uncharacterized protein n=1 Tax=Podoviridae sp. ct53O25 TaxID=2826539 RepID=A0A8S5MBE7_9CAUD|nr:MAG TPA: hypothetical protein [Podoviridae sp. ct53O25]DAT95774.1 MAG TPA: hypothetical protein [Caudoviricetes sp.]DAU77363.1 MAG TPA: hypothetical protein [Caudoviricetes sp.]
MTIQTNSIFSIHSVASTCNCLPAFSFTSSRVRSDICK